MVSLLPESMRDESNLAIEECINQALSIDMSLFLSCIPENLSDEILFEKAKMFHVLGFEGWQRCQTREDKITLLKNAIKNHRFKGTVKSIKTALSDTNTEYLSWQKYNGLPNHFKIKVYTEKPLHNDSYNKIVQTVNEYKRLSSKMDSIEINTMLKDKLNLNSLMYISRKVIIQ